MSEITATTENTSVVSEKEFPKTSTRLQELMQTFRGVQPVAYQPMSSGVSNPLANVKIVSELSNKRFDDLTPEHQQKVLARVNGVDYMVSSAIQNFGSTKDSAMTKHAEVIIAKYSANEFNDLANPLTELVASIKANDASDIVSTVKPDKDSKPLGIFASIRKIGSLKKAKKRMYRLVAEHDSIKKNLEVVSIELKKHQVNLQKDIQVYEAMSGVAFDQIYELELDCIALDLMIEEAEERLNAIISKGEIDHMEAAQAKNLKAAIDRMIRRKNTIMSIRVSALQNIPMIGGIILGDEIVCEKIDEVHSLVIPMWTWQYAIAIGHLKQQEALSIQKTIRGITARLLTGNAQMLHDNIIAAQEELYSAAVAIEDLLEVQEYIDDMVTKVQSTSKEARQKCLDGMEAMKEIEQKNYLLMAQTLTDENTAN